MKLLLTTEENIYEITTSELFQKLGITKTGSICSINIINNNIITIIVRT